MKFSEMPYTRVLYEAVKGESDKLTAELKGAASYEAARAAFLGMQKLSSSLNTNMTLAEVRHTIDTNDAFYDAEKDHCDQLSPMLQELDQVFTAALLESPFRGEFEAEYGGLFLKNAEIGLRTFAPQVIPDLQEENKVTSEYVKLIASAQIPFEGQTLTLSQLTPYMQSAKRETRAAAWNANGKFFADNGEKFDSLYDRLVAIRTKIGKALGHENFIPTGYDRMTRNSYTEGDVDSFRKGVRDHIVPVAKRLKEEQAARLGVAFPMTYPDDAVMFPGGNAKPSGTPDDIMAQGKRMYHELSLETAEFIDFMLENELFDVLSRKGKAGGGYCTSLPDFRSPFIFANFNGTSHDVEVITHEAGHAFAAYRSRDLIPMECRWPTLESCEIHSMSMEFFAWPWCQGFFGADTQKFYYQHLANALTFIPYGTMVDHFQHEVYRNPAMTPAKRHELWGELEKVYRPWIDDRETTFYKDSRYWQRQAHIYENPFYYIDYCLAQTVALQFWAAIQKDQKDAWRRYMALVSQAGTKTFDELVAVAGMSSPFGGAALEEIASAAMDWLGGFDRSKLV